MGYYTRPDGVKCFEPDDTDNTFYMRGYYDGLPLSEILEQTKEKWPNASFDDVNIASEYIQTRCIGYDLYDPSDYDCFLVITYNGG